MLTTEDGTLIPAEFERLATELRHDLEYGREHWEETVPQLSTDWTMFNEFLSDVFGTVPHSRFHGGGGREPDDVLRSLLRLLPMQQRLAIEYEYRLWPGEELPRLPESVLAYALDLPVRQLRAALQTARASLMRYREPFLVQLAFAQLRQAEAG